MYSTMPRFRKSITSGSPIGITHDGAISTATRIGISPHVSIKRRRPLCTLVIEVDGKVYAVNTHRFPIEFNDEIGGQLVELLARPGAKLTVINVSKLLAGFNMSIEYATTPTGDGHQKRDGLCGLDLLVKAVRAC